MENILICTRAVMPMFIYILIGVVIKRAGLMNNAENKRFNKVLFTFFYPVLMYNNIHDADLTAVFDIKLVLFAIAFIVAEIIVITFVVMRLEPENRTRGAMIQAIYRSNFVLMGIMIVQSIFGKEGLPTVTMLVTVVVPFFNIMAVIVLEYFRGGRADFKQIAVNTARNPLILGAIAGAVVSLAGIEMPETIQTVMGGMADATTPMAMVMLGVSFDPAVITSKRRDILICIIGRLIMVPMIGLPIAALLGFRGAAFVSLVIMMASPTAVSSFPMAEAMDSDGELAGSAVMISTPLSCITLFLWLLIFKNLGIY